MTLERGSRGEGPNPYSPCTPDLRVLGGCP